MRDFAYHQPATVPDAVALLGSVSESRPIAGGMTLLPTLKNRLASPSALIDLAGLPGLQSIEERSFGLAIGALARHADVARSRLVATRIPALARLAGSIGDPAVRHRGTIGGSLANNDPAADYPAAALALGARIVTNRREIPADDFFLGLFETALGPDELITGVVFPAPKRAGYAKLRNPASRYAVVGVFVAETANGIRVAMTGAGNGVVRVPEFEQALATSFAPEAVAHLRLAPDDFASDMHAEAAYRAHLASVMAARAVADALA
ncbi:FAD binding domain-containing protein [Lichenifustis flavocetrariae]|uniref:FAD binding domain-containing protein n=1 Tax=Lichenifustis flavocetrariae TaxID=2949735 RepID=A0AA42CPU4_9HYPH|nr:FAD binding domain-containing protein [Lichenifustis flavocetrariae]MCW6510772.1 FAD binding domain-containing protein [Lichenifustis flavocetrariae]